MLMRFPAVLAVLTAAACVSVNKSVLAPNPTGRTFSEQQVYVYFEDDEIPEHTRLAILSAEGDAEVTDESDVIDEMRKEAGKLGANAIVLREITRPGTAERIAGALLEMETIREARAVAIYVPSLDTER